MTDEEIQALGLNFTCAGCGRPEASVVTKLNHERHCNYLKLAQYWDNPNDEDGEWPVDKVLSVRGPPGRRFVQLQWSEPDDDMDTTDFEHADLEVADGTTKAGDGVAVPFPYLTGISVLNEETPHSSPSVFVGTPCAGISAISDFGRLA